MSSAFSRRPAAWAALFLTLVNLALFLPFLNPWTHWVLSRSGQDLDGQFVWWRQFGFSQLARGHLALWDPKLFCGEPFFGGFQSALLYPPNWLFMVLPLPFALNFSIVLHLFLAGWFTFLWIRGRGHRNLSALAAALMFPLGGAYFLHLVPGHLPNLCTMAWISLVFLAVEKWGQEGRKNWILWGALVLALQVFSGHIQYVYYTVVLSGCYALYLWARTERRMKLFRLSGFGLLYLGAGLLAAVQLLAGWDAGHSSVRGHPLSLDFLDIADITPERMWCLLMPDFFGGWKNYWGGGMYPEGALFISVTGFVLALFALKSSPRPEKKFFGTLALLLALIGVGKRTPLFAWFCHFFPLFGSFRGVGKLNIFISLCLIVLAAMGMDEILEKPQNLKSLARGLVRGAMVFLAAALLFAVVPSLGGERLFGKFLGHAGAMTLSLLRAALTLGILSALAAVSFRRPAWRTGFLILVLAELFLFAWNNRPYFDFREAQAKAGHIQAVYDKDPGDYRVFACGLDDALGTRGADAWGDDPAVPWRYNRFVSLSGYFKAYRHSRAPLGTPPPALGLTRLRYALYGKGDGLVVQRLKLPGMPRALLVGNWRVSDLKDIWPRVLDSRFNPRKTVWLESPPPFPASTARPRGTFSIRDLSTDSMEVTASLERPAVLVLSENYTPGWKARALPGDGQGTYRVVPANGFQRAVPLLSGDHHFLLEYRPTAFVVGRWISILAWLGLLGLAAFRGVKFIRQRA